MGSCSSSRLTDQCDHSVSCRHRDGVIARRPCAVLPCGVRGYAAHLYLPPRASKVTPRGHPSTGSGSPRVMPFAETARAPKISLRSEVAYGSKETAAGIRLRRLDAARTDSGGCLASETEGDVMRSFAEDGSHAPPGASHNMPFCSTGGTRQRPRCRSGGRRPAAKRGLSRKAPRRYRFQGGAFRLRPRPPLLVWVAPRCATAPRGRARWSRLRARPCSDAMGRNGVISKEGTQWGHI